MSRIKLGHEIPDEVEKAIDTIRRMQDWRSLIIVDLITKQRNLLSTELIVVSDWASSVGLTSDTILMILATY